MCGLYDQKRYFNNARLRAAAVIPPKRKIAEVRSNNNSRLIDTRIVF